jgi:NDP-sugar pyrophosphorylase family protein
MKAMVLTAGMGTRLMPLTLEKAKPAIPLLGKPLILTIMEKLSALGINEFRLNLHTLPDTITRIFDSLPKSCWNVSFSYEPEILGTAGGLKANESFFSDETLLVVNGDIFFEFDIRPVIDFHIRHKALATLALCEQRPPYNYTPIRIDSNHLIQSFPRSEESKKEKGPAYVFSGVTVLSKEIFGFIEPAGFSEIVSDVYEPTIAAGFNICGYPVHGYWNDLGTPARYLSTQRELFIRNAISPPRAISDDASVADADYIGPYVSIEQGCVIEDGCVIQDAILWENCHIRRGSTVRNCILGQGMVIQGHYEDRAITLNGECSLV